MTNSEVAETANDSSMRLLRLRHNISLRMLAGLTGIPSGHLALIEQESPLATPTAQNWQAIARALGCSVADLRKKRPV
jgi:transcriptional regulator with XRE-family HTH domain